MSKTRKQNIKISKQTSLQKTNRRGRSSLGVKNKRIELEPTKKVREHNKEDSIENDSVEEDNSILSEIVNKIWSLFGY